MRKASAVAVICLSLAAGSGFWPADLRADHDPCPHLPGWIPDDLDRILEAHRNWMIELGFVKLGPDDPEPTEPPDPAVLCRADLRDAELASAYLVEVDFRKANLSGANLSGANMIAANLTGAILAGANLDDANLFLADLRNADLTGASLRDAHLVRTNLEGAKLDDADATGVTD